MQQDIITPHGKSNDRRFRYLFLRQTQQQQRCENFADYLRAKKNGCCPVESQINLRELHAQTQTASDCRAWMR